MNLAVRNYNGSLPFILYDSAVSHLAINIILHSSHFTHFILAIPSFTNFGCVLRSMEPRRPRQIPRENLISNLNIGISAFTPTSSGTQISGSLSSTTESTPPFPPLTTTFTPPPECMSHIVQGCSGNTCSVKACM